MSAPKFTSGKWTAAAGVNQMVSGDTTVWAAPHVNADEHGDSEATARLIAAAPELYEALHKIAYEPIGDAEASAVAVLDACVEIARAALAKAVTL